MMNLDFDEFYQLSISEPETMWDYLAQDVVWSKPYTSVVEDKESAFPKWFVGGEINMCFNCLDKQVNEGHGNDVAVIYDSPSRNIIQKFTYQELLDKVSLMAGVLVQKCGITKRDKVFIYLPMIPEAQIAILACTRIGATYNTTFVEYAPKEIRERIKQFKPKLVITSNISDSSDTLIYLKRNIDEALQLAHFQPEYCIVYNIPNYETANMTPNRDLDWSTEIQKATPHDAIPVPSNHPLFISYTSGTTGQPKGIVKETGGSVVVDKFYMKHCLNMKPNETLLAMSSFSWILGQILSYGCLMSRQVFIIYEGKPKDRKNVLEILRILRQHRVVNYISLPSVMRSFRKYCNDDDFRTRFENLKFILLTGELFDSSLQNWITKVFNCHVCNAWGQTEMGVICYGPFLGFRRKLQEIEESTSIILPGLVAKVVDKISGNELPIGCSGRLLLKLPLTPARAFTIYENNDKFYDLYFRKYSGYYDTMDSAVFENANTLRILSRDDAVIHVSGIRINGFQIEEAVLLDENLDAASIIALEHPITGFVPFGFLVPRHKGCLNNEQIIKNAIKNTAECIGDVACFQKAVVVPELPRTKMGKVIRYSLEMMANGKEFKVPPIIENPEVYSIINNILLESGYNSTLPIDL